MFNIADHYFILALATGPYNVSQLPLIIIIDVNLTLFSQP
jgi:hypothetical protein